MSQSSTNGFLVGSYTSGLEKSRGDFYEGIFAFDKALSDTNDPSSIASIIGGVVEDFDPGDSLVPSNPIFEYRYEDSPTNPDDNLNTYKDHIASFLSGDIDEEDSFFNSSVLSKGLGTNPLDSFDLSTFEGLQNLSNYDFNDVLSSYIQDVFEDDLETYMKEALERGPILSLGIEDELSAALVFGRLVDVLFSTANNLEDYVSEISKNATGIFAGEIFEASKENAKQEMKEKPKPMADGSFSEDTTISAPMIYSTPFAASLQAYSKKFEEQSRVFVEETIPKLFGDNFDKSKFEKIKEQFTKLAVNLPQIAEAMSDILNENIDNLIDFDDKSRTDDLMNKFNEANLQKNKLLFLSAKKYLEDNPELDPESEEYLVIQNILDQAWLFLKNQPEILSALQPELDESTSPSFNNNLDPFWNEKISIPPNTLIDMDKDYDLDEDDFQKLLYNSIDSLGENRTEVLSILNQNITDLGENPFTDSYEASFHDAVLNGNEEEIDLAFNSLLENSDSVLSLLENLDALDGMTMDKIRFNKIDYEDLNNNPDAALIHALDFNRDGLIEEQDIEDMLGNKNIQVEIDIDHLDAQDISALKSLIFNYLDSKHAEDLEIATKKRDFYEKYGDENPLTDANPEWNYLKNKSFIHSEIQTQLDSLNSYAGHNLDLNNDGIEDLNLDKDGNGTISMEEFLILDKNYDGKIDYKDMQNLLYQAMGGSSLDTSVLVSDFNTSYDDLNIEAVNSAQDLIDRASDKDTGFLFSNSIDIDNNGKNDILDLDNIHETRNDARKVSNSVLENIESSDLIKQYEEMKKMILLMMFLADMERNAWDEQLAIANTAAYEVY